MYGINQSSNQNNKKIVAVPNPKQNIFDKIHQGITYLGTKIGAIKPSNNNDVKVSDNVQSSTMTESEKNTRDLINDVQNKIYEREDALRRESYEREDSKYQRSIADARKSGIDPNQLNTINTSGYTPQNTNNDVLAEQVTKQLEDALQDQQLSNETFNRILQVVGNIVGLTLFKKSK